MSKAVAAAPYTLRNIEEMLGLSRGAVLTLMSAGFVLPTRGPRNEYRFSFRDVVLLRTAHRLTAERIPTRRLLRALRHQCPPLACALGDPRQDCRATALERLEPCSPPCMCCQPLSLAAAVRRWAGLLLLCRLAPKAQLNSARRSE